MVLVLLKVQPRAAHVPQRGLMVLQNSCRTYRPSGHPAYDLKRRRFPAANVLNELVRVTTLVR